MNNDLKKLMEKMGTNTPAETVAEVKPVEKVAEVKKVAPVVPEAVVDDDEEEEEVNETPEIETYDPEEKDLIEVDKQEQIVMEEVGMLQNNGIFRRELLATLKHLALVHEANTQTLMEIKKKLLGEKDDS